MDTWHLNLQQSALNEEKHKQSWLKRTLFFSLVMFSFLHRAVLGCVHTKSGTASKSWKGDAAIVSHHPGASLIFCLLSSKSVLFFSPNQDWIVFFKTFQIKIDCLLNIDAVLNPITAFFCSLVCSLCCVLWNIMSQCCKNKGRIMTLKFSKNSED